MKINFCAQRVKKWPYGIHGFLTKPLYTLLICSMIVCNAMGSIFAQNITLKEKESSLRLVLEKIVDQTSLDLVGNISSLRNALPVNIDVKNKDIKAVLQELSHNQPVELTLKNRAIILTQREERNGNLNNRTHHISNDKRQYTLTGKVTDENHRPLKGVTVQLLNSSNWASVTTDDGSYSVMVKELNSQVKFSMLGYQTKIVNVEGRKNIDVVLIQEDKQIEEAIVTAYSKFNKETFTGSATTITKQEIQKMSTPNILTIIQSMDASFVLTENLARGSDPNRVPEASMRGIGNITGTSSNPLIILDGFQISMRELYDIDIERIESIHILKDATATALYGSRGANGVIQIETSLPKEGKLTISYSMMPTTNLVDLSSYNLLNAKEKLEYERLAGLYELVPTKDYELDYVNQVGLNNIYNAKLKDVLEGVDTYWLKQPIRHTFQAAHNLTIGGGANNVRYQLSGNYANRMGTMKGADRTTYGASFRFEYRLPNKLTFSNQAAYSGSKGDASPYGFFSDYTLMNPYWRIYDEHGEFISKYEGEVYNPLFIGSLNNLSTSSNQVIRNNTSLEWRPTDSWMLNATASIEKNFRSSDNFTSPHHPLYLNEPSLEKKGRYNLTRGEAFNYEGRLSARFNRIISKHIVAAQLTGEVRSINSMTRGFSVTGFSTDVFIDPSLAIQYTENTRPTSIEENARSLGVVGAFDYSYDQRYSTQMSMRLDASSLYGKNERYQCFPSVGVRWNVHNEPFFESLRSSFDRLSFRGSYGVSSNQNFSSYQAISTYVYESQFYYNTAVSNLKDYGNENLKWQNSRQLNVGFDMELLDRRLGLDIDYYHKMDDGMVIDADAPPSLGFSSFLTNLGAVRNKGLEATLTAFIIQREDFSIKSQTRAAKNRSRLLNISEEYLKYLNIDAEIATERPVTKYIEGESISNLMAVRSLGIDPANGKEIYLTKNDKQTYIWDPNDRVIVGDEAPKIRGNQSLDIFYKNFSLFVVAEYSLGRDLYNSTLVERVEGSDPYKNVDRRVLDDRWKQPGDITFYRDIKDTSTPNVSTRFVQTENFLNLTNITLRYNDRRDWIRKYKIVDLTYSISVNNLPRISNVEMERGTQYPFEKSISGSVRITF